MFALAFAAAGVAQGACPTSTITAIPPMSPDAPTTHTSSAPFDSLSGQDHSCETEPSFCRSSSAYAAYDLAQGRAQIYMQGYNSTGEASCVTHDAFTLLGPSGPSPITFHVRLHATIYIDFQPASATVGLCEGSANCDSVTSSTPFLGITRDLDLMVTRNVDQTFDLSMQLRGMSTSAFQSSGSFGHATAQLEFPDLPPGFTVTSCQGFASSPTVAIRRNSWGSLKSMYR